MLGIVEQKINIYRAVVILFVDTFVYTSEFALYFLSKVQSVEGFGLWSLIQRRYKMYYESQNLSGSE